MSAADTLRRLRADGFSFAPDGQRLIVRPASRLTADIRSELQFFKADLVALLEAERQDAPDPRVTCQRCAHYRAAAHRCGNHVHAMLLSSDISPTLAAQPQHCPGHEARQPASAAPASGHQAPGAPPAAGQATGTHPEPTTNPSTAPAGQDGARDAPRSPENGSGRPPGGPGRTNGHPKPAGGPYSTPASADQDSRLTEPATVNSPRQPSQSSDTPQPSTGMSTSAPGCTPLHRHA